MTNGSVESDGMNCREAMAALARGGDGVDWDAVERHLATCSDCQPGLELLTAAIDEQFAAGMSLDDATSMPDAVVDSPTSPATPDSSDLNVVPFPSGRRRWLPRVAIFAGAAAAALVVLVGVLALRSQSGGNQTSVAEADRRPQFVPSLQVLPERPDHTYLSGEQIQVCLKINQPSRIHLSVIEGHTTFDLYDADSDPGEHCLPERVAALRGPATLRVEVFYGKERVAREDFPLRPGP